MPANDPANDPLLDALRALPTRTIEPRVDQRALRRARVVLLDTGARQGGFEWLKVLWSRALAPLLVTGVVASYLVCAVQATDALYR
jgi:hypothetical protein